jgi:hypothetical protein
VSPGVNLRGASLGLNSEDCPERRSQPGARQAADSAGAAAEDWASPHQDEERRKYLPRTRAGILPQATEAAAGDRIEFARAGAPEEPDVPESGCRAAPWAASTAVPRIKADAKARNAERAALPPQLHAVSREAQQPGRREPRVRISLRCAEPRPGESPWAQFRRHALPRPRRIQRIASRCRLP